MPTVKGIFLWHWRLSPMVGEYRSQFRKFYLDDVVYSFFAYDFLFAFR